MREEKQGAWVAGTRQVLRQITAGKARRVLIANDADARIRQTLAEAADAARVPVEPCESMAKLGAMCRIAVPCAAAAEINL